MIPVIFLLGTVAFAACSTTELTTTTAPPKSTTPSTSTSLAPNPGRTLEIPVHVPPKIDGILEAGEWDGSTVVTMTDDSSLHWMHADDVLYMAVESSAVGAVNLAISIGDETWILHSSAALGSAQYVSGDAIWELSYGFEWCCRSATDESALLELLDDEGWQANIGFTGDVGIVEYQVTLPWNGAFVAVSYLTDSETRSFWPADLSSEAREQLVGPPPTQRNFNLGEWYTLASVDI